MPPPCGCRKTGAHGGSCYQCRMNDRLIRIIGLDPGLRRTGWGIIESDGVRLTYVASGLITSDAQDDLAYRLRELYEGVSGVIASFKPAEAAVEESVRYCREVLGVGRE